MNAWNDLEQIKSEFCIVRFSHSRFSIFMHDLWVCFINHAHRTGAGEWVSRLAYSEVPNRRADWNKQAGLEKSSTLLAYLLIKLINKQGGIFRLLNEKL